MKLNDKDPQRTLHADPLNNVDVAGFILIERLRHTPIGRNKSVWEEDRIFVSNQEILKLAKAVQIVHGVVGGTHE